jgi:hypothetical protein
MRYLALLALLLPAACGPAPGSYPMPDEECRKATLNDPAVRERESRYVGVQNTQTASLDAEEVALKRDTYLRCMRAHGRAPLGGVEPIRKY